TSFLAGLAVFFFLRETLKHCRLLYRPSGIAFLYLASSIPIQVSVSTSINLDGIVLSLAAAVFCTSVHMLWPGSAFEDFHQPDRPLPLRFGMEDPLVRSRMHDCIVAMIALCSALAGAALTKFSGVVLLAIPAFVAWAQPYGRGWWRRTSIGAMGCALAIAMVFPYYFARYYAQEGRFFPLTAEWNAEGEVHDAIAARQKDPEAFFAELFAPTPVHAAQGPTFVDTNVNHLSDTWRDIWIRNQFIGETTPGALRMGLAYMGVAPWLMLIGFIIFLKRIGRRTPWIRLGWVLLGFSLLQCAALIQYIYRVPFAGWYPAKGLYILPSIWGITYLIVTAFSDHRIVPQILRRHIPLLQHALMGVVTVFVILNHGIPVY
ncbi:MAG: hypothetical protein Greene101449_1387, partial [Candidatus Peregrinibacteria bacterium Greene1014_49]